MESLLKVIIFVRIVIFDDWKLPLHLGVALELKATKGHFYGIYVVKLP